MELPKDYTEFHETLSDKSPPIDWPEALKALWHDAKGDWHSAHDIVDGMEGSIEKQIHGYLHRKEGDEFNAGYWYRQAGKTFPQISLEEELQELVEFVLQN